MCIGSVQTNIEGSGSKQSLARPQNGLVPSIVSGETYAFTSSTGKRYMFDKNSSLWTFLAFLISSCRHE